MWEMEPLQGQRSVFVPVENNGLGSAHSAKNGIPTTVEERFLCMPMLKTWKMAQTVLTKAFLQPANSPYLHRPTFFQSHPFC